jgi:hypothetical protein
MGFNWNLIYNYNYFPHMEHNRQEEEDEMKKENAK